MRDCQDISVCPVDEESNLPEDFVEQRKFARRYKRALEHYYAPLLELFPDVEFCVTSNPHDFGDYPSVVVHFDGSDIHAVHFMLEVEGHCPSTFEELETKVWQPKSLKIGKLYCYDNEYDFDIMGEVQILELKGASVYVRYVDIELGEEKNRMVLKEKWIFARQVLTHSDYITALINTDRINIDDAAALRAQIPSDDQEFLSEPCYKCKTPTQGAYIQLIVDGEWGNHPICEMCWRMENPDLEPARMIMQKES